MKKLFLCLLPLSVLALTGCHKTNDDLIVGQWEAVRLTMHYDDTSQQTVFAAEGQEVVWEFDAEGLFTERSGTRGNTLITNTFHYSIDGTHILSDGNLFGTIMTLDDKELQVMQQNTPADWRVWELKRL